MFYYPFKTQFNLCGTVFLAKLTQIKLGFPENGSFQIMSLSLISRFDSVKIVWTISSQAMEFYALPHLPHHAKGHTMLQQPQQQQYKHLRHCECHTQNKRQHLSVRVKVLDQVANLDARCLAAAVEQFISCSACSINRMSSARASRGFGL